MSVVIELPPHFFNLSAGGSVMTGSDQGVLAAFGTATAFSSYEPDPGHDGPVRPGDGLAFANIDGDPVGPAGVFRGMVTFTTYAAPDLVIPHATADAPHLRVGLEVDAFGGVIVQSGDGRLFVASDDPLGDVGVTAQVWRNGLALSPIRTSLAHLAADICAAALLAGDMAALVQDFARRVPHDALVSNITAPHETFTPPSDSVVCFIAGTSITTSNGPVAVESLRVGDLVATRNRRFQPVRWANTVRVTRPMLQAMPNLRPIRIRAGALGRGTPTRDVLVSPQHRVQVPSSIANDMFAAADVLIAAKHLVGVSGIEVAEDVAEVTYCHVLCNDHEIAHSDDLAIAATGGSVARQPAAPHAQRAMFDLFPHLADPAFTRAKDRADRSDARRTGAW